MLQKAEELAREADGQAARQAALWVAEVEKAAEDADTARHRAEIAWHSLMQRLPIGAELPRRRRRTLKSIGTWSPVTASISYTWLQASRQRAACCNQVGGGQAAAEKADTVATSAAAVAEATEAFTTALTAAPTAAMHRKTMAAIQLCSEASSSVEAGPTPRPP